MRPRRPTSASNCSTPSQEDARRSHSRPSKMILLRDFLLFAYCRLLHQKLTVCLRRMKYIWSTAIQTFMREIVEDFFIGEFWYITRCIKYLVNYTLVKEALLVFIYHYGWHSYKNLIAEEGRSSQGSATNMQRPEWTIFLRLHPLTARQIACTASRYPEITEREKPSTNAHCLQGTACWPT